jgi:mannose-6-phosphate isomerase-like protein (cupin superfamily)
VWGKTAKIFATSTFELHRLVVKQGHRCSRHRHLTKFNGFYVEMGTIMVTVWQKTGTVDVTMLDQFESMVIPPGVDHMFEGIGFETVVYESYWTELHSDDIVRVDVGE